ncbi:MAG TPA: endonuclease domain-containing protein [Candidatus Peribacterales bacterium]|nr:endonuclease domain-containing protein [Candidatus Peribacterales bacterium]
MSSFRFSLLLTARELRKKQTPAEKMLWAQLRRKLQKLKFYRQVPIDRYIVDFYCPEKHLIIEVDGGIHNTADQMDHDEIRTEIITALGFRIIRFSNEEVLQHLRMVLQRIREACDVIETKQHTSPSP